MRQIAFGLLLIAAALALATKAFSQEARFLVCPPHLSYCYYERKPILVEKRTEDEIADIQRRLNVYRQQLHNKKMDNMLGWHR